MKTAVSNKLLLQALLILTLTPVLVWAQQSPKDIASDDIKPVDISVASTPDEFRCEALQISDFDQVNESMASLKKSLQDTFGVSDACATTNLATKENQKHLNKLLENINGGVGTIRAQLANQYVENLAQMATGSVTSEQAYEITARNKTLAKDAVQNVVGSIKELNALIEKNPLSVSSSASCKNHYSSAERVVFGVAELVEDVSPLLIQAVTKIPGLQELAPAVMSASMVSSAVTQYAEVAQKRVDINKVENRNAILINTCQLVKTYDKMKMLRGLKHNPAQEKQKLSRLVAIQSANVKSEVDKMPVEASESEWINAVDQQNQNYLYLQDEKEIVGKFTSAEICERKSQVLNLANSVMTVHQTVTRIAGSEKSIQDDMFVDLISKYKVLVETENLSQDECARATKSLYSYVDAFNRRTFQVVMDFKKLRMAENKNFFQASYSLSYLRSFQNLLEDMDTNNLFEKMQMSIARTEALLNQSKVLKAWFGNAKYFYVPGIDQYRNPVMDLMNYYEKQVLIFRKPLAMESTSFEFELWDLFKYWHPQKKGQSDEAYIKQYKEVRLNLSILNPVYLDSKNVATASGRSNSHERACNGMVAMRNNFRSMMEAWNTMKYFCQMLKPLLREPEVSYDLKERCMGINELVPNSPNNQLSGVDMLLEPVSSDVKRMPIIEKKIKELNCES